ncbi:MAG: Hpt domain-containing protein [Methylococcales bacterium]|nr:Hpt domain-containing protein [Methylococcales bacterium]MDD5753305.1 Hpt domain-containing protein [Methylococcales bacterium]
MLIYQQLPPFDLAEALELTNHNATLLNRLLISFHHQYVNTAIELRQLIATENFSEAKCLAHSLKGVAGTLAASELKKAAEKFEVALDSKQHDKLRQPLDNLTTALSAAIVAAASLSTLPEKTPHSL